MDHEHVVRPLRAANWSQRSDFGRAVGGHKLAPWEGDRNVDQDRCAIELCRRTRPSRARQGLLAEVRTFTRVMW